MIEEEVVGWHHQFDGHEFEQTPGDSEGKGSLEYCNSSGCKELGTTEQLNNNTLIKKKKTSCSTRTLSNTIHKNKLKMD